MSRSLRSLTELFVLPGLAALLPWSWCYPLFRRLSRLPLYDIQARAALSAARRLQAVASDDDWLADYRLTRLCDHADLFLSRTRTNRWIPRHLRVSGQWPLGDVPFLAVTFHWGAGLWSLRQMRALGLRSAFLSIRFDRTTFEGDPIAYSYARLRTRELARVSGANPIFTSGATAAIRAAWREGINVVALYDVPPHQTRASVEARVLDRDIRLPSGLVELACKEDISVVTFNVGVDALTGARVLEIGPAWRGGSEADLVAHLALAFEHLLRKNLAAWHLCGNAAEFFPDLAAREST